MTDLPLRVTARDPAVRPQWRATPGPGVDVVEISTQRPGEVEVALAVPLGGAVGFWHPGGGPQRTLPPDWAGRADVSLVSGAPVGCLFDDAGRSLLAFAAADVVTRARMRYGVSEEGKRFEVRLEVPVREPYRLALHRDAVTVAEALRAVRAWRRDEADEPPAPTPEAARVPLYSTWYAFGQQVTAESVEREAAAAAELGCGAVILDDGWQRAAVGRGYAGCGQWTPDPVKFGDLPGHVRRIQAMGLRYLLWVAPLLLGENSPARERLSRHAPARAGAPGAYVLDPRVDEVHEHVTRLCRRLVAEYGFDGLKIDFLEEAMVYGDVGPAMRRLLASVRDAVLAERGELLVEFRQPYAGPGVLPFATMLRAADCPGDATVNRISTLDIGLLADGGAVHSDMLLWDTAGAPSVASRQLIAALHAVPQISVRPTELTPDHAAALGFWLRTWRELRPVLLDGRIEPGRPDEGYPLVTASAGDARVITVFADRVVPLDAAGLRSVTVINATGSSRLVAEVAGEPVTVEAISHDTTGRLVGRRRWRLQPGPMSLAIPPYGLMRLSIMEGDDE